MLQSHISVPLCLSVPALVLLVVCVGWAFAREPQKRSKIRQTLTLCVPGLKFDCAATGWYYVSKIELDSPADRCGRIRLMDELISIDETSVNPRINQNMTIEHLDSILCGPLGSQLMLSFRQKNIGQGHALVAHEQKKAKGFLFFLSL